MSGPLTGLASKALEAGLGIVAELQKEARATRVTIDTTRSRECLLSQMQSVETWANAVTLLSLLKGKRLRECFVELSLDVGYTPFARSKPLGSTVRVADIVRSGGHAVILGGPGAGKTTSLQKIAQVAIANREAGQGGPPVLVRLRDLRDDESLVAHLLALLGIAVRAPQQSTSQLQASWERRALFTYLSAVSAVVLIDGLDEALKSTRRQVELDLRDLVLAPGAHRLFVTCRNAEYTTPIPTAEAYTILPLSRDQVAEFAQRWLGERSAEFTEAIQRNPYSGTEVVPLTLAHLCAIFERDGELPPRPIEVYEQIVSLLIEEWDRQRQIIRQSRYSDFSWRKKERFLQAIAFALSMRGNRGSFTEADLGHAYREIASEFSLPLEDSLDVVREVESHTGLVQQSGHRRFDFVHLSIQEYLAAMYAHRRADAVQLLVPAYPNELALVIAYSTSPDQYLERVVHDLRSGVGGASAGTFLPPFLARLSVERPSWRESALLGWLLLYLFDQLTRYHRGVDEQQRLVLPAEVFRIFEDEAAAQSVRFAAAEAEVFEEKHVFRLIPKVHASVPDAVKAAVQARADAGLVVLRSSSSLARALKQRRKQPRAGPKRPW